MTGEVERVGARTIGKYRILEQIGGDARVVCYLAENPVIGRTVEVHCLALDEPATGDAAAQLLREARVLGGATHRNLQGVVDSGHDAEGRPYVVFEALRGVSLAELILKHPRGIDPMRTARIIVELLEALRALHDAGVVLRTLGPKEVMVEVIGPEDEHVKVRGVHGAALMLDGGAPPLTHFTVHVAPELRQGGNNLDPRVDYFSVGVMLRQLLTGRANGDDEVLSDTARRAIARAVSPDPDERFASADGFLQAVALMLPSDDRPEREQIPTPSDPLQADLQYLHLRRITRHGPRSEMDAGSRMSLLPVLLTIEAVYRRFGKTVWDQLCARVKDAESLLPGSGNTPVHLSKGVPVPLFAEILIAVDEIAGNGDLSLIAELGEAVAQRGLHRLFPDLPKQPTPEVLISGFPYLWSCIGRDGRAEVQWLRNTSARLSVAEQSTPSLELAGLVAGLIREALRISGAYDVEVVLIGAQALGDGRDLFGVEWT